MTKRYVCTLLAIALILGFASCNKQTNYPIDTQYIPVKLKGSDKWSILNLTSGEIIAKDAFAMTPSAVVSDRFYVPDSLGMIDFYSIEAPTKPINKEKYGSATIFGANGRAIVSTKGSPLKIIDKDCNVVATLAGEVSQAGMFLNGLSVVQTDQSRFGYIKDTGDTLQSVDLARAFPFVYEDVAIVSKEAKDSTYDITVINRRGKELFSVSSIAYKLITPQFNHGVLPVQKGDTVVCLNHKGDEVPNPTQAPDAIINAKYKSGGLISSGYYVVMKDGKMGMVDRDNKVMIPFKYQAIIDVNDHRYLLHDGNHFILADEQGNQIGKAEFEDYVPLNIDQVAIRGFIDNSLATAFVMQMFNAENACGATASTTLTDMNTFIGSDPEPYAGSSQITQRVGPAIVQYLFDKDIASQRTDSVGGAVDFNYDAKVKAVTITIDLHQTANGTEEEMARGIESNMGLNGFVIDSPGVFTSEAGSAVSVGYRSGIFQLYYFMNKADAKVQPRESRK